MGVVWVGSLCAYLMGDLINIPVLSSPFFMVVFMFAFVLNPLPVCYFSSRKWVLKVLVRKHKGTKPYTIAVFLHGCIFSCHSGEFSRRPFIMLVSLTSGWLTSSTVWHLYSLTSSTSSASTPRISTGRRGS